MTVAARPPRDRGTVGPARLAGGRQALPVPEAVKFIISVATFKFP